MTKTEKTIEVPDYMVKAMELFGRAIYELKDPSAFASLTCMMIDRAAYDQGMTSIEWLEMVKPIIAVVNADMGSAGIAEEDET